MARFSLLLYVIFVLISQVFGQLEGDCRLDDVTEAQWQTSYPNVEVNDNHEGQFQSFKSTNVKDVTLITSGNQYARYFKVELTDENDVVVGPSDDFPDLELNENSDETFVSIFVRLRFECNVNSRTLTFRQPIKDLNTFTPKFNQSSYNYLLPMPLAPDFNVGCLGGRFEVCDSDITNTMLNFAVDPPEDFSVTWERAMNETNKCHYAVITTKRNVRLEDEQTYQITVTDVGTPPRSSTASLTIQVDQANSLPSNPHFEAAFYKAIYNSEGQPHTITIPNPIRLTSGYTGITLELKGGYSENFEAHLEADQITVTLETPLPEEVLSEDSAVFITIEADLENAEGPGRTVLIVELPERPPNPQFEYASYTATYDDDGANHRIIVDGSIRLVDGYSGIRVELQGDHSDNFDVATATDHITVTLNTNLPGNVLADESSIILTIKATLDTADVFGTTALVVQLPKDPQLPAAPQFEFPSYTAIYNNNGGTHSISIKDVIRLKGAYSGITVALEGDHSDNFDVATATDHITVTLNTNLPGNVLADESSIILTIKATLDTADVFGETVLVVQLPKDPEFSPAPQFESTSYVATYNVQSETHSISVNGDILLKEEYTGLQITMLGEYESYFTFSTENKEVIVTLKRNLPGDVLARESSVLITIEATLANAQAPGRTVLAVQLPKDLDVSPNPQFESPFYSATYKTDKGLHSISVDGTIRLEKGYTDIELQLLGDYKDNFKADIVSNQIVVTVVTNLPDDALMEHSIILLTIEATLDNAAGPGRTVLVVELPTPPFTIKFEDDNYVLNTMEKYEGFIAFVRATAIPEELIKYSLEGVDGASVPPQLKYNEDTGELRIEGELPIGEYSVIAVAKGTTNNIQGQASVLLNIYENTGELQTTDSIIVEHVLEKETVEIELPCEAGENNCEYVVFEQYPETNPRLFDFYDGKLHSKSLDRQMDEVKTMPSPQFTVSLQLSRMGDKRLFGSRTLNYTSQQLSKRSADYPDNDREWVYIPENVIKKPDQLLVSVIIDDINDNYPIFENPGKLVVGYPTKELAIQLAPPYLAIVKATDLDVYLNAKIKYISSSTHFIVHPETGVIYPTEGALDNDSNLQFKITAIDRNGADDGLQTDLDVEVIPLEQSHLTVLTVKNVMLEDVDNKLQELNEETGMQMKYLTAAVIPNVNTYSMKTVPLLRDSSDCLTRIVVYALDSENDPIETDKIQEELEEAGVLEDISVEKWSPSPDGGNATDNCEESSVAGFIAAVSVLASLLIIFIIAAAVFYYFKIYKARKPEPYVTMEEEDTGSITFEKNPKTSTFGSSDKIAKRRPTEFAFNSPPVEEDDNESNDEKPKYENPVDFYVNMKEEKNGLYDTPVNYSTDTGQKSMGEDKQIHFTDTSASAPAYDVIGGYEEDEFGERKLKSKDSPSPELRDRAKSVSFKPTVEKINIVTDDNADDIFDERL